MLSTMADELAFDRETMAMRNHIRALRAEQRAVAATWFAASAEDAGKAGEWRAIERSARAA